MFRNFKLLFLPLDGGGWVGVMEKVNHPLLAPPIKGGEYLAAEGLIYSGNSALYNWWRNLPYKT